MSASMAEKLRKFERSCLRVALHKYRTPESQFTEYHSNHTLYNLSQIPRIDIFILQLTRNYIASTKNSYNNIVHCFSISKSQKEYSETAASGYFPPQHFTYFDKCGLIQDEYNIPIIYHMSRHKANKNISFTLNDWNNPENRKYNYTLSFHDKSSLSRLNKNYWWLSNDARNLDDLRRRAKHKKNL